MKHVYNLKPSLKDRRNFKFSFNNVALPESVDLTTECPPIKNQGQVGSCSAFALVSTVEFLELKELGSKLIPDEALIYGPDFTPLSELFQYWNERAIEGTTDSDAGCTTLKDGYKALLQVGLCSSALWPYVESNALKAPPPKAYREAFAHRISSYLEVNQDLASIKSSLALGFPVVCGIMVYESFESATTASSGIIKMPRSGEKLMGGHAVTIVGYDDKRRAFILRNSWGTDWALRGYAWIPYDYLTDNSLTTDLWTTRI